MHLFLALLAWPKERGARVEHAIRNVQELYASPIALYLFNTHTHTREYDIMVSPRSTVYTFTVVKKCMQGHWIFNALVFCATSEMWAHLKMHETKKSMRRIWSSQRLLTVKHFTILWHCSTFVRVKSDF